jgi:hypothetical protein
MKLDIPMKWDIPIIIVLSFIVIVYSTDISKSYPEKLIELMKEKFIVLLFILSIMYIFYLKQYTIAILISIMFIFLLMEIPLLTETFLDDFQVTEKQQELLREIEKLKGGEIVDTLQGGDNLEKIIDDLKETDTVLDELENLQ